MATDLQRMIGKTLDYQMAALWALELKSKNRAGTKYKGTGRPRKTDYAEYVHPFDNSIIRILNK